MCLLSCEYYWFSSKVINFGKNDPTTSNNALLINATETANKLSHQLDELNGLVSKVTRNSFVVVFFLKAKTKTLKISGLGSPGVNNPQSIQGSY